MSRVHTVTLNPAIDQTVSLPHLAVGEVNRASAVRHDPGGKGVNVASVLADWGVDVMAHGLLGRANAAPFEALFSRKSIADRMVRMPGETRTNVKILEEGGRTTDLNLPGFAAGASDLGPLADSLSAVAEGELVVISGSHPAGLPASASARLAALARERGARVLCDVSGEALVEVLAAPVLPDAIKPNRHELEGWAGRSLADRAELAEAARALVARGIALVVVSLGTEGALFCSAAGAVLARPVELSRGSTVGAGDAMVAGLASALVEGLDLGATAARATAFAAAKLRNPGPHLPGRDEVRALEARVERVAVADWIHAAGPMADEGERT
ncbi:1-phosphofructokinase [Cereibacter azotoformans]|uniref:1-phosphofructokinase n=1 Tax=Cereibacter azotoformans TaxID=43057 RepID=UPI003B221FD9